MDDEYTRVNRARWDERVSHHVGSAFYDVEGFLQGKSTLKPADLDLVGDVRGRSLVHLQCHFGLDTLSWAREGARVAGLDYSQPAIDAARDIAKRAELDARFVCADVHDAADAFEGARFDWVVTGVGALCWLPSVRRWASVVASLLVPGGRVCLREGHPMLWALDETDPMLPVRFPYFETEAPAEFDEPGTYTDPGAHLENTKTYIWNHGIGEVVTALLAEGFVLERLEEHRAVDWCPIAGMAQGEDGMYRLPPERRDHLPLMYALVARRS